jgi:hypothetical protein
MALEGIDQLSAYVLTLSAGTGLLYGAAAGFRLSPS